MDTVGIMCILGFALCIILEVTVASPARKRYLETIQKAVNCNYNMQSLVYLVHLPQDEILRRLGTSSETDELECKLDAGTGTVIFSKRHLVHEAEYQIAFEKRQEGILIRLTQSRGFQRRRGDISIRLNTYFIQKLDAEIVSYLDYEEKKVWKPI